MQKRIPIIRLYSNLTILKKGTRINILCAQLDKCPNSFIFGKGGGSRVRMGSEKEKQVIAMAFANVKKKEALSRTSALLTPRSALASKYQPDNL